MRYPDSFRVGQRVKLTKPQLHVRTQKDTGSSGDIVTIPKGSYATVKKIRKDSVTVLLDYNNEEHSFEAGYLLPLSYIRERLGK